MREAESREGIVEHDGMHNGAQRRARRHEGQRERPALREVLGYAGQGGNVEHPTAKAHTDALGEEDLRGARVLVKDMKDRRPNEPGNKHLVGRENA